MKKADFGVAIYLLAAVIFFIIPIPSILLDVMLAINISLAMIILFKFIISCFYDGRFYCLSIFTTTLPATSNASIPFPSMRPKCISSLL